MTTADAGASASAGQNGAALPASIAIVGAGAIGSRLAAQLEPHGIVATLFDGWREHVDAIRMRGLTLDKGGARSVHRLPAHHLDEAPANARFEAVLLAVRGDATAAMMPLVGRLVAPGGFVVSCQNGISEDVIAAAVGPERTLGCSMIFGARLNAPGVVEALPGEDTLCVGEMAGPAGPRAFAMQRLFACCGSATTTDHLLGYRWKKLMLNCMGNPLTLLTGQVAVDLHASNEARHVMIGIAREVLAAARAFGHEPEPVLGVGPDEWLAADAFDRPSLHRALRAHGDGLGQRRFSMWADFEARGRTEVDTLNGYVARKAAEKGLPAPLNEAVVRFVHAMEQGQPRPREGVIAELHRLLRRP